MWEGWKQKKDRKKKDVLILKDGLSEKVLVQRGSLKGFNWVLGGWKWLIYIDQYEGPCLF